MNCIDTECENITNSPDADAGRLLIQNWALSQDGIFPVSTVICCRPIVRIFYALSLLNSSKQLSEFAN